MTRKKRLWEKLKGPAEDIRVSRETYNMVKRASSLLKQKLGVDEVSMHYTVKYAVKRLIEELMSENNTK
ncbi:MAG: hypothetical protein DSO07_07305 [Thermoproteota archaeon]|nr:MAG: hypothetical protein DSO07_07305 [Candidatus Korarchaeota archaeon]